MRAHPFPTSWTPNLNFCTLFLTSAFAVKNNRFVNWWVQFGGLTLLNATWTTRSRGESAG